jgi:3-deoxy-D-manno-octulosonate 8-phosphate phosphatase KdsC-like HAD superfamily phosphatase
MVVMLVKGEEVVVA